MDVDDIDVMMTVAALLLLTAIGASRLSSRLGVPALVLFLGIGMIAGSEGVGGLEFDDYELAQGVGIVALAFILFAGGYDTHWRTVKPQVPRAIALATVGVLITAGVTGVIAAEVLDVSLGTGLLLGAVVSSTDAAAVFAVLRGSGIGLKRGLKPLLELESGFNDPMAVFLTLACIELIEHDDATWYGQIPLFISEMAVGAVVGLAFGRAAVILVNRLRLEYEGLYPVVLIAVVLAVFGVADLLHGSGFLAVYIAGLVLGNARLVHQRSLGRFADALAWLMQIAMFLVLGLLVFPSDVLEIAGSALVVSLVLVVLARPVAVALVLGMMRTRPRDIAFVAWVGLRGAVPIILATFPLVEGVEHADLVFNVVFFIVVTSVLVQGSTLPLVARWLGVAEPPEATPASIDDLVDDAENGLELHQLSIPPGAGAIGRQIVDLDLPSDALIVLIRRGQDNVVPQGSTVLAAADQLTLIAGEDSLRDVQRMLLGRAAPDG
jgi:cell volume regulation protein A